MPFFRHRKFTFLQRINEHLQKKSRFFKKVAYLHGNLEQKTLLHGDLEPKMQKTEGKSRCPKKNYVKVAYLHGRLEPNL